MAPTRRSSQPAAGYGTRTELRPLWDPRDVLGVDPDEGGFTCTGTTQKGLRCRQSKIKRVDLNAASSLLDSIARTPPDSGVPLEDLEDLAYLTLCPRWHRKPGYSQVESLSSKWEKIINRYISRMRNVPLSTVRAPRITETSTDPLHRLLLPATSTTSVRYESTTVTVRRETVTSTRTVSTNGTRITESNSSERRVQHTSRRTREIEESQPRPLAPPPPRSARAPPSPSRPTVSSRASPGTQELRATVDPPPPYTSAPSTPASSRRASPAQSPSRFPSRPTTPPTTNTTSAPTTPDCPICLLPITPPSDSTNTAPDRPLYCLAQCHQPVHSSCFSQWRTSCLATFARQEASGFFRGDSVEEVERLRRECVKCVMCRAVWEEEDDDEEALEEEASEEEGSEEEGSEEEGSEEEALEEEEWTD